MLGTTPRHGFTLVELLVIIAIIVLLIGLLLPAVAGARQSAMRVRCLSNIRNFQIAHTLYMQDHNGRFIDVGLSHGTSTYNEDVAWINTLEAYYGSELLRKSPVDTSPHWSLEDGGLGIPVPPSTDVFRRTSYGVNNFLSREAPADPTEVYDRLNKVSAPSQTIQFIIMAEEGEFAASDHPHVENWWIPSNQHASPVLAASQLATSIHGGPEKSWDSVSNYGFLDGHAESLKFSDVYLNPQHNLFDPKAAFRFSLQKAIGRSGG